MILTCPSCSTKFSVDIALFRKEGVEVRCGACKHTWVQLPIEDEKLFEDDEPKTVEPETTEEETPASDPEPEPEETPEESLETDETITEEASPEEEIPTEPETEEAPEETSEDTEPEAVNEEEPSTEETAEEKSEDIESEETTDEAESSTEETEDESPEEAPEGAEEPSEEIPEEASEDVAEADATPDEAESSDDETETSQETKEDTETSEEDVPSAEEAALASALPDTDENENQPETEVTEEESPSEPSEEETPTTETEEQEESSEQSETDETSNEEENLDIPAEDETALPETPIDVPEPVEEEAFEEAQKSPIENLSKEEIAAQRQQARKLEEAASGKKSKGIFKLLLFAVLFALLSTILVRQVLVDRMASNAPALSKTFMSVGFPVYLKKQHLIFSKPKSVSQKMDGESVLVIAGSAGNVSDISGKLPPLFVTAVNKDGDTLAKWRVHVDEKLLPRKKTDYSLIIDDMPDGTHKLMLMLEEKDKTQELMHVIEGMMSSDDKKSVNKTTNASGAAVMGLAEKAVKKIDAHKEGADQLKEAKHDDSKPAKQAVTKKKKKKSKAKRKKKKRKKKKSSKKKSKKKKKKSKSKDD